MSDQCWVQTVSWKIITGKIVGNGIHRQTKEKLAGNEGGYGVVIIGRDRMGGTRQKKSKEVISNVKKQFLLPSVRGS